MSKRSEASSAFRKLLEYRLWDWGPHQQVTGDSSHCLLTSNYKAARILERVRSCLAVRDLQPDEDPSLVQGWRREAMFW